MFRPFVRPCLSRSAVVRIALFTIIGAAALTIAAAGTRASGFLFIDAVKEYSGLSMMMSNAESERQEAVTSPLVEALDCGSLLARSIVAPSQIDQFTFVGNAGETKTLTLTSVLTNFVPATAKILSPTHVVVVIFNSNRQEQLTLAESGTYMIQVYASDSTSTGNYNIGLECLLPTSPVDGTLACGTLLSSRPISASGQVDQITFSGQANGRVTLTLTSILTNFVPATATIFSPTLAVVATLNSNVQQQLTLPETGTYVIQVRASNLVGTGNYNIGLECLLPTSPVHVHLNCLTLPFSGAISSSAEVHQITFTGQANDFVTLTLTSVLTNFVPATATVFSPTAVLVATFNSNNQHDLTLPESGTYVVQVRASDFVSTGSYSMGSIGLVCTPPIITGTVAYGNAIGAPTPRFVSKVTITGAGSPTVMTTTGGVGVSAGQYTLDEFGAGSYTVTPTKTGGVNGAITSLDAARIAQHAAGVSILTGNPLVVADVSGNGIVTSFDAGMIAKFVVGPPYAAPGIGLTGTWRFLPVNRMYASVTANVTGQDYTGLLMGEVSGNWTNTGARPAGKVVGGQWSVDSKSGDEPPRQPPPATSSPETGATPPQAGGEQILPPLLNQGRELSAGPEAEEVGGRPLAVGGGPERAVAVEIPQIATVVGKEVIVPINVDGAANKGIIAYEFDLRYDPSVIQPQANAVDLAETVSRGLSVATNASEPGLLRVVVYGAYPIDENGVLLNLRFAAVGKPGSVSPLGFERIMFNEGEPRVTAANGQVELF